MQEKLVIDLEAYLTQHGASRQDIGDAALHRGINTQSQRARRENIARQAAADHALIERRAEIRGEYYRRVDAGEIRPPSTLERLRERASGHPDNASTQAARRILKRRFGIVWPKGECNVS